MAGTDRGLPAQRPNPRRVDDRPRQVPGIQVHRRAAPSGATIITLKDPRRGAYHRLSPAGLFLWQRLDGAHAPRDLTLDYLVEYGRFGAGAIFALIDGLASAGFIEGVTPVPSAGEAGRSSWRQHAARRTQRMLEWYVPLRGWMRPSPGSIAFASGSSTRRPRRRPAP